MLRGRLPMLQTGNNDFQHVAVPLAIGRRYFIFHDSSTLSVLYDDPADEPVWEIQADKPGTNATSAAPGVITVVNPATGQTIYKVRPGTELSILFGNTREGEVTATITARHIDINGTYFERARISASGVGIMVTTDGRQTSMGMPIPAKVLRILGRASFVS